jgi:hypothetical protein
MSGVIHEKKNLFLHIEHIMIYSSRHRQTPAKPDRTSNMAARRLAAIFEYKISAITPDLMAGLSPNFNHRYI